MINERIKSLRDLMNENKIDAYIVPSEDFHQSEYVGEYFKAREFITGFSGSAGLAIITMDEAHLWTDGRYFTQANIQLAGSEVNLQKMGVAGVPTPLEYLNDKMSDGATIALDGRCVSVSSGQAYCDMIANKNGKLIYNMDLIDKVWANRPELSKEKAFFLSEQYTGESTESKIARIRKEMLNNGADIHIVCGLDDVCWIMNIRGNDVKFSPLVLTYAIITQNEVHLFADRDKFDEKIMKNLESVNTILHPYDEIYNFVKTLDKNSVVLLDSSKLNYALYNDIPSEIKKVEKSNPSILFKATKNEVELKNIKNAHIKDGIAWTKFMYWIKNNIGKIEITEIGASDKLEDFRKEQDGYLWPSFAPISGYRSNGAIVHYSASEESNATLEPKSLYLSDTGGNYLEGSTDITRTLALGELTEEEKRNYTIVLKSHINLAMAKFLEGTSGYALDILARKPMWELGMNYNHGTGHGVGYLLNIHEAPSGIRYKINPALNETHPFVKGMIVTDEPGLYIEGRHGIRIENELIVVDYMQTEYGNFFGFEPCTYVPIDLDAVDISLLSDVEKEYLNDYHSNVYSIVSPYLTDEEKDWMKQYTRQI